MYTGYTPSNSAYLLRAVSISVGVSAVAVIFASSKIIIILISEWNVLGYDYSFSPGLSIAAVFNDNS